MTKKERIAELERKVAELEASLAQVKPDAFYPRLTEPFGGLLNKGYRLGGDNCAKRTLSSFPTAGSASVVASELGITGVIN